MLSPPRISTSSKLVPAAPSTLIRKEEGVPPSNWISTLMALLLVFRAVKRLVTEVVNSVKTVSNITVSLLKTSSTGSLVNSSYFRQEWPSTTTANKPVAVRRVRAAFKAGKDAIRALQPMEEGDHCPGRLPIRPKRLHSQPISSAM